MARNNRSRGRRNRRSPPVRRAVDRVQSRQLAHIKGQTAVPSRVPADPPHLNRSFEMDMVLDWYVRFGTTAARIPPTPQRPGFITITSDTATITTDTIVEAIASRFGFAAGSYPAWRQALDSVALVKAALWGPIATGDPIVDSITLEMPYSGPGYAVSGNGQASTTSDSCGKNSRARCALSPPVLNWWDPRFATSNEAFTIGQVFFAVIPNTNPPTNAFFGLVRFTVRMKFGVANSSVSRVIVPDGVDETSMDMDGGNGGETQSSEQLASNAHAGLSANVRTLGTHLGGMAVSEIGSRIVGHTMRRQPKTGG